MSKTDVACKTVEQNRQGFYLPLPLDDWRHE